MPHSLWPPPITIRPKTEVVEVEVLGRGIVLKRDASVALRYIARPSHVQIVAVGREAAELEDDAPGDVKVVALADAPWWNGGDIVPGLGVVLGMDEHRHDGEIIIVRPFSPATLSPAVAAELLAYVWVIDYGRRKLNLSLPQRWLSRIDVEFPTEGMSAWQHDAFVRGLWASFMSRVTLNGRRLELKNPPRLADASWEVWGMLGGAAAALSFTFYHGFRLGRPMFTILCVGAICVVGIPVYYRAWYFKQPARRPPP